MDGRLLKNGIGAKSRRFFHGETAAGVVSGSFSQNARGKTRQGLLTVTTCILLVLADIATACPNCVAGISGPGGTASSASAFNTSIVFMASMPLLLATVFSWKIWRLARQANASELTRGSACPPSSRP